MNITHPVLGGGACAPRSGLFCVLISLVIYCGVGPLVGALATASFLRSNPGEFVVAAYMLGSPSAFLCAVAMMWLQRRLVSRTERIMLSPVVGGLTGAIGLAVVSVIWISGGELGLVPLALFFGALAGAVAGFLCTVLTELVVITGFDTERT